MELEDVRVIKSSRRSFCLEITPKLEVILRAPSKAAEADIRAFFESKRTWLSKHTEVMKARAAEAQSAERLSLTELEALKAEAREVIPERVRYFADMMSVSYAGVTVRHQKTRWGSCSAKKNLSFNCLLLLFPEELLDYVIVHELCHIKYMNHSAQFWREVEKYMPDYKRRRALLKKCRTDM